MNNPVVFDQYANYYDLLYRDKDYEGEVRFVDGLIRKNAPDTLNLLELGCGTGIHAEKFTRAGYAVHGIDGSPEMLKYADQRIQLLPEDRRESLSFSCGDIRRFYQLNRRFDAVLSLFHVICYQTDNQDLSSVFDNVKQYLNPKGLFIFDCWYGPAVLTDPPAVRVKRLENTEIEVTRIAEPAIYPNENRVDVNYQVFIKKKSTGEVDILNETHKVRYLFMPEIMNLCERFGFSILEAGEWMTGRKPDSNTWAVYFVVRT
ncbi:MAG: class I SAM-dependent methyltransferase [Pseudomonadota bacterium]